MNLDDLEKKAREATLGPWIGCGPSFGEALPKYLNEVVVDREGDDDDCYEVCRAPTGLDVESSADMAYIAAANPSAILDLISRCRKAEEEVERLNAVIESQIDDGIDKIMAMSDEQISALAGYDGRHPDDQAAIARKCLEVAERNVEIAALKARIAELEAQSGEAVAWLFTGFKPGCRKEFASVDSSDSQTWPTDDGMKWDKRPLYLRAPQVPPGWKLVPDIADEAMKQAAWEVVEEHEIQNIDLADIHVMYCALIAAAPSPKGE